MTLYLKTVEEMLKVYANIREAYSNYLSLAFEDGSFSPNEINILIFLYNNPNINTSKELTLTLGVSKGLISRSVESLISKGLLIKEKDVDDRRSELLKLSEKAKPLIVRMEKSKDAFAQSVIKDIDVKDLAVYQKVQQQIDQNLLASIKIK